MDGSGGGRIVILHCGKSNFKDKFPLLYKAAEELDAECLLTENELAVLDKGLTGAMSEEDFKRCKKGTTLFMNEVAQSKRGFAKLATSGFCVTQRGEIVFAEGGGVLTTETKAEKISAQKSCRRPPEVTKVPEMRTRMRKNLKDRHITTTVEQIPPQTKKVEDPPYKIEQGNLVVEFTKTKPDPPPTTVVVDIKKPTPEIPKDADVDTLVKMIEGTRIGSTDPKKAAKKARQKEKKEMEKQKAMEDQAREEEERQAEEVRRLAEILKNEEAEKKRIAEAEQRRLQEVQRKQKEVAEQRKEEQRKKRQEIERRKAEEKKLKKEAKKLRREQRKKDLEEADGVACGDTQERPDSHAKSDSKKAKATEDSDQQQHQQQQQQKVHQSLNNSHAAPEKEYGRIKHEKEQRKREEEEARRLEQLQAQERAQANKKNKKKKKKNKHPSESHSQDGQDTPPTPNQGGSTIVKEKPAPVSQPLMDLLSNSGKESGKNNLEDKSNLVTIKKHQDSSVTISMRGREGENDLVYTLMNGQVYPTSVDGKIRTEDALPIQHTAFVKPESVRPNQGFGIATNDSYSYANPAKSLSYPGTAHTPQDNAAMAEIDLSQLKLPPGITITKVPQHLTSSRPDDNSGTANHDSQSHAKAIQSSSTTDYNNQRSAPISGMDSRCNSNIMVVDSRCSSIESPVIGIRSSDMVYGANGTRPSSEASMASDRPSSGMDSICNNNGASPFVGRTTYQSTEMLNSRITMPMSSPFAGASRNETPSPAWQQDMNPHYAGLPGMFPGSNAMRPERQPYWSSTPASPVAFPASNSVTESYLRAQDQQFIRPQIRGAYPHMAKRSSIAGPITDNGSSGQKAAEYKPVTGASSGTPAFPISSTAVNGSRAPSGFGPVGYKPVIETQTQPKPADQWTPWNNHAERYSPEQQPNPAPMPFSTNPYGRISHSNGDVARGRWEAANGQEKPTPAIGRGINPYGPIGSNITRRPGTNNGNGLSQNGSATENSGSGESAYWSFNPRF